MNPSPPKPLINPLLQQGVSALTALKPFQRFQSMCRSQAARPLKRFLRAQHCGTVLPQGANERSRFGAHPRVEISKGDHTATFAAAPVSLILLLSLSALVPGIAVYASSPDLPFPLVNRFESFGMEEGLPSHKVHCVLPTGDGKLWIGTTKGLVIREHGKFRHLGTEEGLSHQIVLNLVEDPRNGDLWIATMKGLNRFSGGHFTSYTQTSSGLPNNVVYAVAITGDTVWAATAAGLGALDTKSGSWKIYDHNNSIMHEPWVYSIASAKDRVFVGVWGGGILEHDPVKGSFKEYRDPDGDFHFDLVPDDGPISDVTSWVAWEQGILWQGSYFGMARYEGSRWRTWVEKKTPLPSNFVNIIVTHGRVAWVGTDRGLSVTDGDSWVNYRRSEKKGQGMMDIIRPGSATETRTMSTALPDDFVLSLWVSDEEAWFATSNGLGHGLLAPRNKATTVSAIK